MEKISLIKVNLEEKEILKNLLSLYLHELSTYTDDLEIDDTGIFLYDSLDYFFEYEALIPYFITYQSKIIGFLLVSKPPYTKPETDYCIQEFFILNKYRKMGLGSKAIQEFMHQNKGKVYLVILNANKNAISFWRHFFKKNEIPYEEDIETHEHYQNCIYQIFES